MLPNPISQVLYGFIGSKVLLTADELGVFEALTHQGPSAADEVALKASACPQKMERLLNAACSFGLIRKSGANYEIPSDLKAHLDPASHDYCGGLFAHFRESTIPAFDGLREEIETKQKRSRHSAPFASIYEDAYRATSFLEAMWNIGYPAGQELAQADIFAGHERMVDVGGATGSFSIAVLEAHRNLSGTIFDLPEVEPYLAPRKEEHATVGARLGFAPGDFWTQDLPPGDIYVFGYIFSDWHDEDCNYLVRKAHDALPEGGRIVVLERFLDDNGTGPMSAVMQDMAMMLETGGRHRRQGEYESMLEQAGFVQVRVIRTTGEKHMVTAIKPGVALEASNRN